MKTFINYLLVCVIIGMTQACSQKTFEEEFVDENPIAKTGIVKFKYQGYIYTSKYEFLHAAHFATHHNVQNCHVLLLHFHKPRFRLSLQD